MRIFDWWRHRMFPELDVLDDADEVQSDVRLDELTRERVRANVLAETACRCPCHEQPGHEPWR